MKIGTSEIVLHEYGQDSRRLKWSVEIFFSTNRSLWVKKQGRIL
jgi:hypothetical protein